MPGSDRADRRRSRSPHEGADPLTADLCVEVLLALVGGVERLEGDARLVGDLLHGRAFVALAAEHGLRGLEDQIVIHAGTRIREARCLLLLHFLLGVRGTRLRSGRRFRMCFDHGSALPPSSSPSPPLGSPGDGCRCRGVTTPIYQRIGLAQMEYDDILNLLKQDAEVSESKKEYIGAVSGHEEEFQFDSLGIDLTFDKNKKLYMIQLYEIYEEDEA